MSSSLSVPHFPQQADGYCLPACVQMVMAYWGIDRSIEASQRIADDCWCWHPWIAPSSSCFAFA
ncbi:MAG: C39 family peptidase [Caldilineaceae bacterium]|nr:C39 family peptidase [Caldilineaceae bacterium]MCB0144926.1 C39 family peptidase [Caldilineaceae bacterium]